MMSAGRSSLAHCRYCGKEFDGRKFQVFVAGKDGTFDSAECALPVRRPRRAEGGVTALSGDG